MIKGKKYRTDNEYFSREKDSSSSLKLFAEDRRKYKKQIIDGLKVEKETNKAMLIGNIVDCQIFTVEEFDNRFYTTVDVPVPTGAMYNFVNTLYKKRIECLDELGVVTKDMYELMESTYTELNIKKPKFEGFVKDFKEEGEAYFKLLCETKPKELTLVSPQDLENAGKVIESLRHSENTGRIIKQENDDRYDVYPQLILETEIRGLEIKMMLDKVEVDNVFKTVTPRDLKVTWNVEDFYNEYYIYRKSYIQEAIYTLGVVEWAKETYPGYRVEPFEFIVSDSINYMHPLIFKGSVNSFNKAVNGFTHNGRYHKGVYEIIDSILWHKETGIWNISNENYKNGGIVTL